MVRWLGNYAPRAPLLMQRRMRSRLLSGVKLIASHDVEVARAARFEQERTHARADARTHAAGCASMKASIRALPHRLPPPTRADRAGPAHAAVGAVDTATPTATFRRRRRRPRTRPEKQRFRALWRRARSTCARAVEPRRAERRRIPARRGHRAGLHEATRRVFIFGGLRELHSDVCRRPRSCSRTRGFFTRTSRRMCDGSKPTAGAGRGGGARTGALYYAMR